MSKREEDQRVVRTRGALVDSFNELVLGSTFERVNVAEVAADAGVGRSTFYEHFRNKDELLLQASAGVMGVLADSVLEDSERKRFAAAGSGSDVHWRSIEQVLEHVRENRTFARSLLSGDSLPAITRQLTDMIETRLLAMCAARGTTLAMPSRMAAGLLAGALFGALGVWLDEVGPADAAAVAAGIRTSARAGAQALMTRT